MTAFDDAWELLKMPIVSGSLEEIESELPEAEGFQFKPKKSFKALFEDPETSEIHPMFIDYINRKNIWLDNLHRFDAQIGERQPNLNGGKLKYNKNGPRVRSDGMSLPIDNRKSITSVNWVEGEQPYPAWTETRRGLKGRGYAPALYDVIAYLMDKELGDIPLAPSPDQTGSAKNMWRGRETWPLRDDL